MQKKITQPILHLVETAKSVSEKKDYSVRAVRESQDELGLLAGTFNEMLSQIQVRDGVEALDFLFKRGEYKNAMRPDLILLDLNLPKKD